MLSYFKWVIGFCLILVISSCSKQLIQTNKTSTQTKLNSEIIQDPTILNFVEPYRKSLDSQMNRVVAYSQTELIKELPESNLSNFFADAISNACKSQKINFDFAMPTTNGGIRSSLPKGEWNLRNIFELMPFENELVLLQLSGKKVNELVEFIIDKGGQPVSGIRIEAKNKKALSVYINNELIDINKTYMVLTSDYLAGGGDGITAFTNPIKRTNLNYKVRDAILDYLETQKTSGMTINAQKDGRVKIEQ